MPQIAPPERMADLDVVDLIGIDEALVSQDEAIREQSALSSAYLIGGARK